MEIWSGLEYYAPDVFEHMKLVAKTIFESGRVTREWITNPQTVLLVMQKGRNIGIDPLLALDHLKQFRNGAAWSCSFDLAKGIVTGKGGTIEVVKEDDVGCSVKVTRPGRPEHIETVTWDDFLKSGQAQKDTAKKYPRLMMRSSAARRGIMVVWPDALAGVVPMDDLEDESDLTNDMNPEEITAAEARPRRGRPRKTEGGNSTSAVVGVEGASVVGSEAPSAIPTPPPAPTLPETPASGSEPAIQTPLAGPVAVVAPAPEPEKADAVPTPPEPVQTPATDVGAKPGFVWDAQMNRFVPEQDFDYANKSHRLQLIAAIKDMAFDVKTLAEVRKKWESGWYRGRCKNSLESIKTALKECANDQTVSQ